MKITDEDAINRKVDISVLRNEAWEQGYIVYSLEYHEAVGKVYTFCTVEAYISKLTSAVVARDNYLQAKEYSEEYSLGMAE